MNVLHISRTMGQGGAEKVVYQLCKDNRGVNQIVASTGGKYEERLSNLGINHIVIPDIEKKNPLIILKTIFLLNKAIRKNDVDIIHSHHRMAAFYARMLQLLNRRLKHVYTAHNVFYGKKQLMRFALKKALIVACGKTVQENLVNEYEISEERITIIYNSIEQTSIKDIYIPEIENARTADNHVICSIGRISKQKGFDVFVKAIACCVKKGLHITGIIVGDGEDKSKIEELACNIGIKNSIVFLGYQEDVVSIIAKTDFVVLASRWEGFPLTPIETFFAGKTIIVSNIKNNLEIVDSGRNGLSFTVDDYEELAERIETLIDDKKLRRELEENARYDYKKKYDYQIFLCNYLAMYERV